MTAYLCHKFHIDPYGTVEVNGVQVPTILCHMDANKLGLGSYHVDITEWYPKHGLSMESARARVKEILEEKAMFFEILDKVKIADSAETYASGKLIPGWVKRSTLYVRQINESEGTAIVSTVTAGAVTGTVRLEDLELIQRAYEWLAPADDEDEVIDTPAVEPDEAPEVKVEDHDGPATVVDTLIPDEPILTIPAQPEDKVEVEEPAVEEFETREPVTITPEDEIINTAVEAYRTALVKLVELLKK